MQQSYLDTDIGRAEFKLIKDQDHFEAVWKVILASIDKYETRIRGNMRELITSFDYELETGRNYDF